MCLGSSVLLLFIYSNIEQIDFNTLRVIYIISRKEISLRKIFKASLLYRSLNCYCSIFWRTRTVSINEVYPI